MFDYISTFLNENKIDISFLLSKLLGYAIVLFSMTLKLPQIYNMMEIKSDRGLSYLTMYTEILIYLFCALYGYHQGNAFSTYGENVFILIQSLAIIILCWMYSKHTSFASKIFRLIFVLFLVTITFKCIEGRDIPEYVWTLLISSSIPLASFARMSQIFVSYTEKDTGPLSPVTFLLGMLGSITRIFTTYTETKDMILIATFVYGAFLNFVVLMQILIYGDKSKKIAAIKKQQ